MSPGDVRPDAGRVDLGSVDVRSDAGSVDVSPVVPPDAGSVGFSPGVPPSAGNVKAVSPAAARRLSERNFLREKDDLSAIL